MIATTKKLAERVVTANTPIVLCVRSLTLIQTYRELTYSSLLWE
jgi:hypothetical protein